MKSILKMRHLAYPLVVLLFGVGLNSCGPETCCPESVLQANVESLTFGWNQTGIPQTVTITSTTPWVVQGTVPSWISLSPTPTRGDAGVTTVQVSMATENAASTPRSYALTFLAANGDKATVTVTQQAKPTGYNISFSTNDVEHDGVTATGTATPANAPAGGAVTVTITLSGTATAAGEHTVGLSSVKAIGITAPAITTKVVGNGGDASATFVFTFTMPAEDVDDLVVVHTSAAVTTYTINTPPDVIVNGVTASTTISPASPQPAGQTITVTVALTGTKMLSGTHIVGLSGSVGPFSSADKSFSATEDVLGTTFSFTFTMPAANVTDLVVSHTFSFDGIGVYTGSVKVEAIGPILRGILTLAGVPDPIPDISPVTVELYLFSPTEYRFKVGEIDFGGGFALPAFEMGHVGFTYDSGVYKLAADNLVLGPFSIGLITGSILDTDESELTLIIMDAAETMIRITFKGNK